MATDVQICNMALARIGSKTVLTALTGNTSTEGITCELFFSHMRDQLLALVEPVFARRRAVLVENTLQADRAGWEYIYDPPAGVTVVKYRFIDAGSRTPSADARVPFTIEANDAGTGQIILTDVAPVTDEEPLMHYIVQHTTVSQWTPLFSDALSWMVAKELAMTLKVDKALRAAVEAQCELAKQRAQAEALNTGHEIDVDSDFITGRG